MDAMSKSSPTDAVRVVAKYRKNYAGCPPAGDVGRLFQLRADAEYYKATFAAGTVIKFLGVVVSRLKHFPTMARFAFPDGTNRYATTRDIKLMPKPTILAVSEPGILDDESYRPCAAHKENLKTLERAFEDGSVCLMEVTLKSTGERVAAICAASRTGDDEVSFTPFAIMLNGNPCELLEPPANEA